jgi:hypothetical protein
MKSMATDPQEIELTQEQRSLLAARSKETGRPWDELLRELFMPLAKPGRVDSASGRTLYEALHERGLIGAYDGPVDLSTNPEHMEGFGEPRHGSNPD